MPGSNPPELVSRIRGEYQEMPGLKLSLAQACRLWQMDGKTCQSLLESLVEQQVLARTDNGAFVASETRGALVAVRVVR